jgi:molybdate transport repressor ModE-like protein
VVAHNKLALYQTIEANLGLSAGLIGDPNTIIDRLNQFEAVGVDVVMVKFESMKIQLTFTNQSSLNTTDNSISSPSNVVIAVNTAMKTEDITLNHIKILKTVSDCGSFSKAAKQLQCSQAMISKKVKQLEECFGVRLLTRSPGAIGLTYKGKKLIAHIQNTVETVEQLQEEFQP